MYFFVLVRATGRVLFWLKRNVRAVEPAFWGTAFAYTYMYAARYMYCVATS